MTHPRRVWTGLWVVLLVVLSLPVHAAGDHVLGVEWFADKTGTLQIHDVQSAPFEPRTFPVVEGFGDATYWLRVRVRANGGGPVHLRVGPNFLDEILLYEPDPAQPGHWRTQTLGDRQPFLQRPVLTVVPTFLLRPQEPEETVYIQVRSTSTIIVIADALVPSETAASDIRLHATTVVVALVMLTMLAWALGTWVEERDPVLVAFVFVQLVYSLQVLAMGGFLPPLVPASMPWLADAGLNFLTVLASFSLLVLNRTLLKPCGLPRWGSLGIDGTLLVLLPVTLVLLAAGETRFALQLSAITMFLIVIVSPLLVLVARDDPPPGRKILFAVLILQGLVMVASRLMVVGVLEGPFRSFAGLRVLGFGQGVISSVLLAIYLLLRQRELRRRAREAEIAVRDHAARIEAMHEELERRAVQAEAGNRAKTAFLAIMGHEFRTPLNAITGYAEALLPGLAEPRQRELLGRQAAAARGLQSMIDDVLDLARASAEGTPAGRDFSPALLLAELRERARERCQAKELALVVELDPHLPASAHGDQARIARVLWHYVDNAIKFTRRGSITLAAKRLPCVAGRLSVRFEVRDTGPGVEAQLRERLFVTLNPHEEYLSRQAGGAGLGLALARQLADAMDGEAGCESESGRGSVFWLAVPLEPAQGDVVVIEPIPTQGAASPSKDVTGEYPMPELPDVLAELGALLGADDMRAVRRFAELELVLARALPAEQMGRLRAQIEAFDFEAASATLGSISVPRG